MVYTATSADPAFRTSRGCASGIPQGDTAIGGLEMRSMRATHRCSGPVHFSAALVFAGMLVAFCGSGAARADDGLDPIWSGYVELYLAAPAAIDGTGELLAGMEHTFCIWIANPSGWLQPGYDNPTLWVSVESGGVIGDMVAGSFDIAYKTSQTRACFSGAHVEDGGAMLGVFVVRADESGPLSLKIEGGAAGMPDIPAQTCNFNLTDPATLDDESKVWTTLADHASQRAAVTRSYRDLYLELLAGQQTFSGPALSREVVEQIDAAKEQLVWADRCLTTMNPSAGYLTGGLQKMVIGFGYQSLKNTAELPRFSSFIFDLAANLMAGINRDTYYLQLPLMPGYPDDVHYLAVPGNPDSGSLTGLLAEQEQEAADWAALEATPWWERDTTSVKNHLESQQGEYLGPALVKASGHASWAESLDDTGAAGFFQALEVYLESERQTVVKLIEIADAMMLPVPSATCNPAGDAVAMNAGSESTLTFEVSNDGGIASIGYFSLSVSHGLEVTNVTCSKGCGYERFEIGEDIVHADFTEYDSEYLLIDVAPEWATGEKATITVTVQGDAASSDEWVLCRMAFLPYTLEVSTQEDRFRRWPNPPESNIQADQQGWWAKRIDVTVTASVAQPVLTAPASGWRYFVNSTLKA